MRFSSVYAFQGISCISEEESSRISLGMCSPLREEKNGQITAKKRSKPGNFPVGSCAPAQQCWAAAQQPCAPAQKCWAAAQGRGKRWIILDFYFCLASNFYVIWVLWDYYISRFETFSQRVLRGLCFRLCFTQEAKEIRKKTDLAHRNEEEAYILVILVSL